jgi:hypothetical protein
MSATRSSSPPPTETRRKHRNRHHKRHHHRHHEAGRRAAVVDVGGKLKADRIEACSVRAKLVEACSVRAKLVEANTVSAKLVEAQTVASAVVQMTNPGAGTTTVTPSPGGGASLFQMPSSVGAIAGGALTLVDPATGATAWAPSPPANAGQFEPDYVFWVARSWPAGADPARFFTSITAAIAAAAPLVPTPPPPPPASRPGFPSPVVVVAPGDYTAEGPIALASGVSVVAWGDLRATYLLAGLTWTPGVGINAPVAGVTEFVTVEGFTVLGDVAVDMKRKPAVGVLVLIDIRNCFVTGGASVSGVPGNATEFVSTATEWALDSANIHRVEIAGVVQPVFEGGAVDQQLFIGALGTARLQGLTVGGGCVVTSGAVQAYACDFSIDFIVEAGSALLRGCRVADRIVAVAAGSYVDARDSSWTRLQGAGAIDRSIDTRPTAVSVPEGQNATPVSFAVPYREAAYAVVLTPLNAAAAASQAYVAGATPSGFTLATLASSGAGERLFSVAAVLASTAPAFEATRDDAFESTRGAFARFVMGGAVAKADDDGGDASERWTPEGMPKASQSAAASTRGHRWRRKGD